MAIRKRILLLYVVAWLCYFFIFASPLGKEHYLYTLGGIDLAQVSPVSSSDAGRVAFKAANYFGYLDPQFNVTLLHKTQKRVAYNDQYYLFYDADSIEHQIFDKEGLQVATLVDPSYPFIYDKNIYTVDALQGVISQYNSLGVLQWQYDTGSFITSIDFTDSTIAVALLNGYLLFINSDGVFESEYRAGGSRVDAVYGVALSKSGRYAAIISGLDPQRFILLERGIYGYTPIHSSNLERSLRRSVRVVFSDNEQFVSYEEDGLYHSYNIKKKQHYFIPVEGTITSIQKDIFKGFTAITSKQGEIYFVKIIAQNGFYPLLLTNYRATDSNLINLQDKVVFSFDQLLLLVERGR